MPAPLVRLRTRSAFFRGRGSIFDHAGIANGFKRLHFSALRGEGVFVHILLVDDNHDVRHTLAALLKSVGHNVESSPNGDDAWSKMKGNAHGYELVVTDVRMPRMTGVEFASRLRAEGSQTPIIFIMGGAESELEQPQVDFLPYAVVQKPFMLSTFLDAVSEVSQLAS